jgi:CMP-N-acetylneuraminic acid synthetase
MGRFTLKTVAIIPARGGSKRIPQKNIIEFEGKPLIVWTIEAARNSQKFDRIVVSTDDPKIAEVAERAQIEVPFLRVEGVDDLSPSSLATITATKQAQEYWKEDYGTVTQLMPNCPLRRSAEIIAAHDRFVSSGTNFQLSCFKFEWMNAWWAAKLDTGFKPQMLFPEAIKMRSQDLEPLYCPTGAVWIAKTEQLMKSQTFYGEGHTFFPIDWKAAVDIDNYEDLEFAKVLFQLGNP